MKSKALKMLVWYSFGSFWRSGRSGLRRFYGDKLGFRVHRSVRNGGYRGWLRFQKPRKQKTFFSAWTIRGQVADDRCGHPRSPGRAIVAKRRRLPTAWLLIVSECRGA